MSGTHDLDPFQDFPDGHSSNRSTQPPHPLSQSHRANPIDPHPSAPPRTTGFDNLGFSMYTSMSGQTGMTSSASTDFVPPPTYQQVEAGSPDAGVTVDWTPGAEEGTGPRRSSTPNMSTDN